MKRFSSACYSISFPDLTDSNLQIKSISKLYDLALLVDGVSKSVLDDRSLEEMVAILVSLITKQKLTGGFLGPHSAVAREPLPNTSNLFNAKIKQVRYRVKIK